MNNTFQSMGDVFFKASSKPTRSTKPHSRKRRANSDSEISFMDTNDGKSFFSHHLLAMHSDDIDIDIMADHHADPTMLSDSGIMDPSQMFIMFTKEQNTFSYSPPQNVMNLDSSNIQTSVIASVDEIVSSSVIDSAAATNSLFQTPLYFVDRDISGMPSCISESTQSNATDLTESQVASLFTLEKTPPDLGHIPAKFLKQKHPCELAPKHVPSQVNTIDGKDDVNQQWATHRDEKDLIKEKGGEWKSGLWSNDEEELLRNNIDKYCKENNISDPTVMIYSTPKEERKYFYRSISVGLKRPLFAVYRKVLRMYDRKNYIGRYTPEECEKLVELVHQYKNNWAAIGAVLGRSAASVKDKVRLMKYTKKKSKWEESELEQLSTIVHEITNTTKGESITTGINWTDVAQKMQTRTEQQCRTKWLHFLNWKEVNGKKWTKADDAILISRVAEHAVSEEGELNWNEIARDWDSVRSIQWLRNKWWNIKKRAPNFQTCDFTELVTYLKTNYVDNFSLNDIKKGSGKGKQKKDNELQGTTIVDNDLQQLGVALTGQNYNVTSTSAQYDFPTVTLHIQLPTNQFILPGNDPHVTDFTKDGDVITLERLKRANEMIGQLDSNDVTIDLPLTNQDDLSSIRNNVTLAAHHLDNDEKISTETVENVNLYPT